MSSLVVSVVLFFSIFGNHPCLLGTRRMSTAAHRLPGGLTRITEKKYVHFSGRCTSPCFNPCTVLRGRMQRKECGKITTATMSMCGMEKVCPRWRSTFVVELMARLTTPGWYVCDIDPIAIPERGILHHHAAHLRITCSSTIPGHIPVSAK